MPEPAPCRVTRGDGGGETARGSAASPRLRADERGEAALQGPGKRAGPERTAGDKALDRADGPRAGRGKRTVA